MGKASYAMLKADLRDALARIRELEADVEHRARVVESRNARDIRRRERIRELEAENARLKAALIEREEKIDRWKEASGLVDAGGDPDGIEPENLERDLRMREAENARLREAGDRLAAEAMRCTCGDEHTKKRAAVWREAKRGTHG